MGLLTKFNERDKKLPTERKKLMDAIETDVKNDPNIIAAFYGGSIAKGNEDNYSDIDLRIIVKEHKFEHYKLNKKERAKKWGDVLFYEDFSWASYSISHYNNFIKVDTFYYKEKDLHASLYLKEMNVIHDPSGLLKNVLKDSKSLRFPYSQEELDVWRGKVFAYLHETYRRVRRKEYNYAFSMLESLRFSVVTGWYTEIEIPANNFGDWSKVEGERSPLTEEQLALLASWDNPDRNERDILNVAKAIFKEFKVVHKNLCKKYNLNEEEEIIIEVEKLVF
ncbi:MULTISPECIES: nucleotidyltransferase domain-containing protein [Bacillus]|uniref:nucleotidyltransferase domain-containing protein n=1 Tax=Bacillus TaxID=1386 RepID=UPI000BB8043C|nr:MULTISPECIES: nucleotidyltransferase domain-containing protein [Bacillus]